MLVHDTYKHTERKHKHISHKQRHTNGKHKHTKINQLTRNKNKHTERKHKHTNVNTNIQAYKAQTHDKMQTKSMQ